MEFLPVQMACQLGLCDLCVVLDSDVLISDSDFAVSSAEQTIDSSSALEETIRSLLTSSDPKPEQPPAIPSTAWERIQALRKVDVSVVSIDAGGPDGVSIESLRELTELISAKRTKQRTEKAIGVVSTGEADREGEDDGMADSSMKLMEKIASQTESFAAVASQRQAVSTVALSNLPQFTPSDPLLAALQGVFMFSFDLLQSPSLLLDLHFTPPPSLSTLHLITPASHVFLTQSPLLSLPTSTASSAPLVLTDPGQIWQKARQQDAVVSSVHAILTHSRRHQTADTLKLLFSPQSTSAGALQSRTLVFALIGATQHRSSQSASQQVMAVVLVQLMPLDETLRTTLPVPPAHHDSLVAVVRHISSHPSMLQTGYGKETMRQLSLFFAGKLFDAMQSSLVDIASDTLPFIVPASHVRPPPVFTLLSTVPLTDTFSSQHASSDWAVPLTPTAAEGVVQFMRCCEFTPVLVRPSPRHTHSARTEWELILVKGVMEKQEEDDDDDAEFAIISQKQKGGEDEWIVTASSVFCSTLLTQLSFPSLPVSPQLAVTLLDSSLDPHAAHFTGLPIANPRPTPLSVTKLSPHDLHRLYQTAQGSIPLPFVTDLIPVVTTQLLSAAIPTPITQQEALILVSVGLKGWSVDETAKVYGLHPSQVRGKIRVACQRVWEWYEAENKDELQNDEEEPTPLILVHHPAPISEDHQPPMLEKQKRPFIERDPNSKQSSKKSKKIKH
ncbi:hypothetical protein BLNAU_8781 [Blattamonas nauphoetae]|uniref:Uncharacterized protein n=1 Tax=Blattamonas nauphoetae TaxID=2049346 RepID=A0ABQ9XXI6_9EUKA|nr:hypothetical protein BLNAU_8781 [Blattamonas nauphoetae]